MLFGVELKLRRCAVRVMETLGKIAGFLGLSCVFALAGVLVSGRFLPGQTGVTKRNPS